MGDYLEGVSRAARDLDARLRQIAPSDATLLVRGESGVGKGAVARRVHELSARSGGPFVEVALAALAPNLIEAELFGHEAGAFTGATRSREGRFRAAQGGTLVLDGIESLPRPGQAKLLRALQERVVDPLGAETPVPIDVRLIVTTSADLAARVGRGEFREDLYWRLAVVPVEVPPLRARLEDLPALAEHLIARLAARARTPARPLSAAALDRLAAHPWPGNVRELENALERVLVLAPAGVRPRGQEGVGPVIEPEEFAFLEGERADEAARIAREALAQGLTLADLERALIESALEEERGNVSAAARRIGLTRRALEYRRHRSGEGKAP